MFPCVAQVSEPPSPVPSRPPVLPPRMRRARPSRKHRALRSACVFSLFVRSAHEEQQRAPQAFRMPRLPARTSRPVRVSPTHTSGFAWCMTLVRLVTALASQPRTPPPCEPNHTESCVPSEPCCSPAAAPPACETPSPCSSASEPHATLGRSEAKVLRKSAEALQAKGWDAEEAMQQVKHTCTRARTWDDMGA